MIPYCNPKFESQIGSFFNKSFFVGFSKSKPHSSASNLYSSTSFVSVPTKLHQTHSQKKKKKMPYFKTSIGTTPEWQDEEDVETCIESTTSSAETLPPPPLSPPTTTTTTATTATTTDEPMADFCTTHYENGLNGRFLQPDAINFFAGASGKFEDPEQRELATQSFSTKLEASMSKMMDTRGSTIIDVGAGTGLFLNMFR